MPEFLQGWSYIDLGLIALGVLALIFGLFGKAPKRIFHLIFVILAIPATYFVYKYTKDMIYNYLMQIPQVKGAIDSVLAKATEFGLPEAMFESVIYSVIFYVIGICALILVPLVGDIIVALCCIKCKKHTAWKTLGLTNLLSVAIAWTFILLPFILLTPIIEKVPEIYNSVEESGLLDKLSMSEESTQDGNDVKAMSLSNTSNVLADTSQLGSLFAEDGIATIVIKQFSTSYYMQFTSKTMVPFVEEKAIPAITQQPFKFLSYVPEGSTEPVGIFDTVESILDSAMQLLGSPIMDIVADLSNGGDVTETLLNMSEEDAYQTFKALQGAAENEVVQGIISGLVPEGAEGESGEAMAVVTDMLTNLSDEDCHAAAALIGAISVENDGSGETVISVESFEDPEKADAFIDSIAGSDLVENIADLASSSGASIPIPDTLINSATDKANDASLSEADRAKYQQALDALNALKGSETPAE